MRKIRQRRRKKSRTPEVSGREPTKYRRFFARSRWRDPCSDIRIVKSVRTCFSAFSLVLALIGSTTASAFVAAAHPICTVKHHDCGESPTIKQCCCDQTNSSDQTGPIAARVTVSAEPIHMVAAIFADVVTPTPTLAVVHAQDSPPRATQFDLQSLFSIFLI